MKYSKLSLLFLIMIFFIGCSNTAKITHKDYKYEKMVLGTHRVTFDIHLENIDSSGKTYNLINSLIYENKNFDEYIEYRERNFTENINEAYYPPMDEDGTEYVYLSELIEKYSIIFNNDTYIIFQYDSYAYISGGAHGNSLTRYFIIDVSEQRILNVDDLINPIPDDLLKKTIESNYDINYYFRDNIWPPDTINFSNENIELLWNTYTLMPYSYGIIRVEIKDEIIEQYLTDKGKALKKIIVGKK